MTEEFKQEEKKCNYECKELFTKLAITTTGAFLGCLLALCVFTTFTKPQLPPPHKPCPYAQAKFENKLPPHHREFNPHKPYPHKFEKKDFRGDWERKRPDRPDGFKKGEHPERPATPIKK